MFAIGVKCTTNPSCNDRAKRWTWSATPVQTRNFDLDGRQTSYPYTAISTLTLTYDLGDRIKNLSGTVANCANYLITWLPDQGSNLGPAD